MQSTLIVIEERLCRIEEKERLKFKIESYAEIAAPDHNPGVAWMQKDRQQKRTPKGVLLKNKRIRKLMIKIIDDKNKKKMKRKIIKDLAEALRVKCDAVTGINRLASNDIRVFTRSQEVKEALQKNIEWITMIVSFAAIRYRIYEVQIHEVRVKAINMINQEKIKKNLQNANAVLHHDLNKKDIVTR